MARGPQPVAWAEVSFEVSDLKRSAVPIISPLAAVRIPKPHPRLGTLVLPRSGRTPSPAAPSSTALRRPKSLNRFQQGSQNQLVLKVLILKAPVP